MLINTIVAALFIAAPMDEIPQREEVKVSVSQEYAEKPKELCFNEYVGYYYE